MAYLDTSILAAYYCPEPLSAAVQEVLFQVNDPTISPLVEVELQSALALKVRREQMAVATASQIASKVQVHLDNALFRVVPIGANQYALASRWIGSLQTALRTLDALHLAAAFSNDLTLISADRSLIKAAAHFGVRHLLVE